MPARLDTRTLRERCASVVRERVINGSIPPGEHIVESRLSAELGVSRGTLREALRGLQQEGLLVDDGRGHLSVRTTSAEEIRQMFVVRTTLESLAGRLLASRADAAESGAALHEVLAPLATTVSFSEQIAINMRFHELLCQRTGNAPLLTAWQHLIAQIEMMIIAAGPERAGPRIRHDDHAAIADAVATGDADHTAAVIEEHMRECEERYLSDFDAVPAAPAA